jgi:plastocyanin
VYGEEAIEFYIKTVHVDGKTNVHGDATHKPEPFPGKKMPEGGGLVLTAPDAKGAWRMRAFTFQPSQIVVTEGDNVRLHFVGVQGSSHSIHVEGDGVDERFTLKRGTIKTVNIHDAKAGVIEIECYDHQPVMNAEVLVLARTK